jgi:hypothetical protein
MSRAEIAAPVRAESSGKKAPKTLVHLEIHPTLGGGHMVRHVYSGYAHEPKEYKFGKDEGERAMAHVARHTGLPHGEIGMDEGAEAEPQVQQ